MRIAVYSTKPYDRLFLEAANAGAAHDLVAQNFTGIAAEGGFIS